MSDDQPRPNDPEAQAAEDDLAAGRYQDYDDMDALIADLDQPAEPVARSSRATPQRKQRAPMIRLPEELL